MGDEMWWLLWPFGLWGLDGRQVFDQDCCCWWAGGVALLLEGTFDGGDDELMSSDSLQIPWLGESG